MASTTTLSSSSIRRIQQQLRERTKREETRTNGRRFH